MDDSQQFPQQTSENKNVLPDVVHSQQILTVGSVATDDTNIDTARNSTVERSETQDDESIIESISEHIPSKIEYSTDSDDARAQGLLKVEADQEKVSKNSSLNIPFSHSPASENPSTQEPGKLSPSWPDVNIASDIHLISEESPVNLALSSDKEHKSPEQKSSNNNTPVQTPRSDNYLDSLNQEVSHNSDISQSDFNSNNSEKSENDNSLEKLSSGSEEIIKLDIRGQASSKFPFQAAKIIFGPPPEGSDVIEPNIQTMPVFPNLISPFLVGAGDTVKVEEVFEDVEPCKEDSPEKSIIESPKESISDKIEQSDLLVEEILVDDDIKEKEHENNDEKPPKSIPLEEASLSTLTTEYKTICDEYHTKLIHCTLEDAIKQRDTLIEELTISLQRSMHDQETLKYENQHLIDEVSNLQHFVAEKPHSDDTVKTQLSDFVKYHNMVKEDSTKFYSALMSGSSTQSSHSEKDIDREEMFVNYSKSLDASDDFQTGFEAKLTMIINKFDSYIEENLRNKLRESLIQVLCDEIGKMRIESDTEIKELETQILSEKQAFLIETRKLRELLASVKTGNADIDELRHELNIKHEKEMENLRTYFEKKCSDMERSYSEEVWRGKCVSPLGSASSLEAVPDASGDHIRRRTKSAEFPSLTAESTPPEHVVKQTSRRHDQQIEELKAEHLAYVNELQATHRDGVLALEEQITQLKAHIQTTENTEASLYQQDIDLELEKKMEEQFTQRLEEVKEQVREEVVNHLQEQLQVLLSDPDAEVSSWPLELVALRERIHGDKTQEKEVSSLRDELSAGEDKWRQRRNLSFDQNRQLEEVTKERDDLKRVAVSLHRVVGQLVAYCACAEDELNRTVLAQLLARLLPDADDVSKELNLVSKSTREMSSEVRCAAESSSFGIVCRVLMGATLDLETKIKMSETSQVEVTELVDEFDNKEKSCDNCELHRKNMEEAMADCLQRENLLRSDLEAALMKIAQLMSADVIAEGYGTGTQLGTPSSLSTRANRNKATSECGTLSLDGCSSPRTHISRMAHDLDALQRERDDLHQQVKRMTDSPVHKICCEKLEAANRQLRSTRQFVEEQASERESERDEFARRLADLREENSRLVTRLQNNARILNEMHCLRLPTCNCREHDAHVEQLETQTREMNQIISELETRKAAADEELKSTEEKITLLRDIIANLEAQLEQKTAHEAEILQELEQMKQTIDDRDSKIRSVLGELESLRNEKMEQSDVTCLKCGQDEDKYGELMEKVKEQCRSLEEAIHRRTRRLECIHEVCSTSCSEPTEDVSLRDQRDANLEVKSSEATMTPRVSRMSELAGVWECLDTHSRAEDAVFKRVADLEMQRAKLKDVAQEVRAERDVLQARMSEQALKISSLSARLQQQRNDAEALSHQATSELSVQLHDTLAEVQRLKEELESKDKQLIRARQNLEERDKLSEQHHSLYGNSCNPKDKVIILERELSSAQTRIAQLEALARSLEKDKEEMQTNVRDMQRNVAEKEDQLQELLALKLDEEKEKSEVLEAKVSARTLSDIVSISEFDEQDLQMRRAEMKVENLSLTGAPFPEIREKSQNKTLPPDLSRPNMSSLNLDYGDHFDVPNFSPRADSLPIHMTSTQNRNVLKDYKRNINETTMFGIDGKNAQIQDNCSIYPNRDVSESKNVSVEPKKINFSLEPSNDNRTQTEEFTSLRELGITLDVKQENFPDILTQLKHEIKKSRTELENCKSDLKNAEEQLCEFPALKEEVEELKGLLENTMATMENDKKFYENQLDNFSSNKKLLEQRLTELTQEVNDKSKDLHLLKEDILRRENMILELAKEKRNLTNKMTELGVKIDELQSRNTALENYETECSQMKEKINELQKLEQLVSEKNQQIDSLNQHLDRLDDLQRCLSDKTEEHDNLKEAFEEKSNQLFQIQENIDALNRDLANANEESTKLNVENKELKLKLTKLEKEQENASLRLQNSESELERLNSLNNELTSKLEEMKDLTHKLKDRETEIEILQEDINSFHEEVASLKEQLKMVSRSPSPKSKGGEEKKSLDRQMTNDKKQLTKIRKQISLLQHELDFNRKELNDKAFELAKSKLDVTELKNNLSQSMKLNADKDAENNNMRQQITSLQCDIEQLTTEKENLAEQLEDVVARLREESNVTELKMKLRQKTQRCKELEMEVQDLKDLIDRLQLSPSRERPLSLQEQRALAVRSPTAELEKALRDQLDYSHTLDEDIMEQILSASSDEHEDIPRLALNTSKSTSSIHSSSSDRINRLRSENDKLQMQVDNLELRLKDKDALITELNRVRDKLVQDWQSSKLRYEAERDNSGRLQLLLDTHKETAETLQNQDSNMIQILKKRLESSMQSELELQQKEQQQRTRIAQLERQLLAQGEQEPLKAQLQHEMENNERLKGEISLLKSKLEVERNRYLDLQAMADHAKLHAQRDLDARSEACAQLRGELADAKRLKHDTSVELLRAKELVNTQSATIANLEKRLSTASIRHNKPINDALTEIESHKTELAREIATLKKCLSEASNPELSALRCENQQLSSKLEKLQAEVQARTPLPDDRDQAIRYLHGRCLRLESCRKALVWQKRYLQRVVEGYTQLERNLWLPSSRTVQPSQGKRRFKCVATAVIVVLRMGFLVRRRQYVRALSANVILRTPQGQQPNTPRSNTSAQYTGTSPPSRDRPPPTPVANSVRANESLARRVLKQEMRLNLPTSPGYGDFVRRSPYTNSPHDEPFVLSSPRGEVAAAYLNKLELVSRCLNQAMDASRDVP
ncbi:hypothetical protein K1T71_009520 [Dendrolimus kikuchii]|uniref:Uncharacterized protein n=1 Tax=Dendrolimus kikuchii TaxID=765133 RepID=A0ACC1CT03_9NEOP|nr:hypothetical protein K1T71_009520 [Dendrolimus kikuchii]